MSLFYFYCPKCGFEKIEKNIPKEVHTNTRGRWGPPIYHYPCEKCGNLNAGFMQLKENTEHEKSYIKNIVNKCQDIYDIIY